MTEIRFYHLQNQSLEQALPALVSKAYENGHRIVIKSASDRIEKINEHLWTYKPESFLPHGSAKDGNAEKQPIWITDKDENPNDADLLILTNNQSCEGLENYKLVCEMFDGRIDEDVQAARARWKAHKDSGHNLTYWQQTPQGGWDKKA